MLHTLIEPHAHYTRGTPPAHTLHQALHSKANTPNRGPRWAASTKTHRREAVCFLFGVEVARARMRGGRRKRRCVEHAKIVAVVGRQRNRGGSEGNEIVAVVGGRRTRGRSGQVEHNKLVVVVGRQQTRGGNEIVAVTKSWRYLAYTCARSYWC